MDMGHHFYMQPLNKEVPLGDRVLYVYYDFETTQNTPYMNSDKATVHVTNPVCVNQRCSLCESSDDVTQDYARCGKRRHSWEDPVGDMLSYLCEPRPWVKQIVAIAHNAKAFDLQFILDRAVFYPELIMNGQKIMCMCVEHIKFMDSISYLPFPLRKLAGAFVL
jgi:hypothetical protein